jgi:hypothetical protein
MVLSALKGLANRGPAYIVCIYHRKQYRVYCLYLSQNVIFKHVFRTEINTQDWRQVLLLLKCERKYPKACRSAVMNSLPNKIWLSAPGEEWEWARCQDRQTDCNFESDFDLDKLQFSKEGRAGKPENILAKWYSFSPIQPLISLMTFPFICGFSRVSLSVSPQRVE